MGFQLQAGEPFINGIRRITIEEIDNALGQLSDPAFNQDIAIHDARKTGKRLRAVLRLIHDEIAYEYYAQENRHIRHVGRLLAPARDSAAMVESLDSLLSRFREIESTPQPTELPLNLTQIRSIPESSWTTLREILLKRHHAYLHHAIETDVVPQVIAAFRETRLHVADWPIQQETFQAISGGLHRVYHRGRIRMAKSVQMTNTETLHDWRKRVKYLWHQLEIIQPIRPEMLVELSEALHTLSSHLGDEHDLAELQQLLVQNPLWLPDGHHQQLLAMITYRRQECQANAWSLGRQLYIEEPDTFVNRLQSYWHSWRTEFPIQR